MEAREFLKQAYRIDERIYILEMQIDECKSLIDRISNLESIKYHNDQDCLQHEQLLEKIIMYEQELSNNVSLLIDTKKHVNQVLEKIEDVDYKILLKMRYLNYRNFSQISQTFDKSYNSIYRLHKKALNEVENILTS